jgi:hypothetical protein
MSRAQNDQVTANGPPATLTNTRAKLIWWRYILIWIATWVVIIMASMTPELLPGVDRSRSMPDWCGPGIDDSIGAASWSVFELICGLLWSVVAYPLHRLLVRIIPKIVPQKTKYDWWRHDGVAVTVALAMSACFGLPLALIDPQFRNWNIAGDSCPTIVPLALKFEACFIPIAFAAASIIAARCAVKRGITTPAAGEDQQIKASDDDTGIWPPAPRP